MFQLVKALFRPAARPARRQPAPRARLSLEALEAREVPTSLSVRPVAPTHTISSSYLQQGQLPAVQVQALPAVQILLPSLYVR